MDPINANVSLNELNLNSLWILFESFVGCHYNEWISRAEAISSEFNLVAEIDETSLKSLTNIFRELIIVVVFNPYSEMYLYMLLLYLNYYNYPGIFTHLSKVY